MKLFKRIATATAAIALAILPVATVFASPVPVATRIESTANVANVTSGATTYTKSTNAKVDDVVKVQVWYHNREEATSGRIANSLKTKINLPTAKGKTQTVTSTVSGTNTNTVVDTTTINLSLADAYLEYIPGSAVWRHNAGTNTAVNYVNTPVSDSIITTGVVLENAKPCFNFEATVTILARVRASAVSVTKKVRKAGETAWVLQNTANAGDTLEYLITFKNEGNTILRNVAVGDNLPPHVTYVAGSTMLRNGVFPAGIKITSNNITTGGIDVGNYSPGSVGYVWFQARINPALAPGTYKLTNVGVVRPEGMNEYYNTAITNVTVGNVTPPVVPPVVPPVTPVNVPLPETGMEGAAAGALGTGVLGYALTAYKRSKRTLLNALRKVTK